MAKRFRVVVVVVVWMALMIYVFVHSHPSEKDYFFVAAAVWGFMAVLTAIAWWVASEKTDE